LAGDASLRIMYDALAGIRPAERVKWLEEMLRASQTCTLVCITHRADVLEKMDQVAVVVGNELTYMGPWSGMPERIKTTEIC
jgi:ABC-type bacteriocin/lantibiotic exporter with double-glycine peptidase domain